MRIAKRPAELGFNRYDVPRLKQALKRVPDKRLFQRVQAVLWVAQGHAISEVAALTNIRVQTVYNWLKLYLEHHHVAALADAPRSGRPLAAPRITAARILYHLRRNPLRLGHRTTVWSVKLLAMHLSRQYHCPITPSTLRRRMKALGLRCKRPRYFYEEKAPHRAQKKGRLSAV
jgi:transposase